MPTPVLARQLTLLLATRRKLYRALEWRSIVPIRTGIPNWVENLEIQKITENANEPVPHQDGNQKAPTPGYDRNAGSLKLFEFALAYQIFQSELDKAAVTGMPVSSLKVQANQRAAEEFLDKCSLIGDSRYGMTGMLKSTDVPVVSINGDWANQDDDQIFKDVTNVIWSVKEQTKGNHRANLVAMPDTAIKFLSSCIRGDTTLFDLIQKQNPGVRFVDLYRLRTADAGNTGPRMVAMDSSTDVLELPMVNELQDGEPLKIHQGFEVLQTLKFGAPIIYNPLAMAYGDNLGAFP